MDGCRTGTSGIGYLQIIAAGIQQACYPEPLVQRLQFLDRADIFKKLAAVLLRLQAHDRLKKQLLTGVSNLAHNDIRPFLIPFFIL